MAYGGISTDGSQSVQHNDGAVIDLLTGTMTDLSGPKVRGGLARATTATEAGAPNVAVAGLQCESPSEDPQYQDDLAADHTSDACSPGPLTISIFDGATRSWSPPSDAPFDYGQSFLPQIIGFVNGQVYLVVHRYPTTFDYISFDTQSQTWSRITAPPTQFYPCLGQPQIIGLSYGTIELYDPSTNSWSRRPIPLPTVKTTSSLQYEWSCTEHYVLVSNLLRPGHPSRYVAYSLADKRWIDVPPPPVFQWPDGIAFTAGDTVLRLNQAVGNQDVTPSSITIGPGATWTKQARPPTTIGPAAPNNLHPYAHAGTHIVVIDEHDVLVADLAHVPATH
jgi:hypothetical protein